MRVNRCTREINRFLRNVYSNLKGLRLHATWLAKKLFRIGLLAALGRRHFEKSLSESTSSWQSEMTSVRRAGLCQLEDLAYSGSSDPRSITVLT